MDDGASSAHRASNLTPASMEILHLVSEAAQLLVMGLLLDILMFSGVEVWGLMRLGLIAAVLVGVLKSHSWLILFALQVSLFSREPSRPEMVFGLVPWLYSLTALCLIIYAYLGKPFRDLVSNWLVTQALFVFGQEEHTASPSSPPQIRVANWMRFIAVQFMIGLVLVPLAMIALMRLPITTSARSDWFRAAIENDFVVWPGATLLALALLVVIVFMEAGWRQMTRAQASLYLRSSFTLDLYQDLKMFVVRRLKKNRKLATSAPQKQLVKRAVDAPPKP